MAPAAATAAERRTIMLAGLGLGVSIGAAGGAAVSAVAAAAPHLLSSDATLWPLVRSVAGHALACLLLTGIDVASCAVNIAVRARRGRGIRACARVCAPPLTPQPPLPGCAAS
eukprot:357374-Chlamydomonas_euryale.AAC.5